MKSFKLLLAVSLLVCGMLLIACNDGSPDAQNASEQTEQKAEENHAGHDHSGHDHSGHSHDGHNHDHDHSGHDHSHDGHNHDHDHSGHSHSHDTDTHKGKGVAYESAYVCPMHCEGSGSDKAGTCPACKMDYVAYADHTADGHKH